MKRLIVIMFLSIAVLIVIGFGCGGEKQTQQIKQVQDVHVFRAWDCGKRPQAVKCALYNNGTFKVTGRGAMKEENEYVWYYYRDSITSVVIGDSITFIPSYAFKDCANLTSVTIGKGITILEGHAFMGCTGLKSIMIPQNVTNMHSGFDGCTGLMSIEVAADNPRFISEEGVMYLKDTTGIKTAIMQYPLGRKGAYTIPDGVKYFSFLNAIGLTSITIPNSVTRIQSSTFFGCVNLTSVTIPNSVTDIQSDAFYNCPNLTSIIIKNPIPPDIDVNVIYTSHNRNYRDSLQGMLFRNTCLYVPKGSIDAYRSAQVWREFECIEYFESTYGILNRKKSRAA